MKKFKLFFYPLYLIVAIVVLYYAIDILSNPDVYKARLDPAFAEQKFTTYLMTGLIFLVILMMAELLIENLHIMNIRGRAKKAEKEVLQLKAKMYDDAQGGTATTTPTKPEIPPTFPEYPSESTSGDSYEEDDEDEYKL